jgi:hypothetical protein
MYPWKSFVTNNTQVTYQNPSTYHSEVKAKVMYIKHQCQGHKVKFFLYPWKGLVKWNTHVKCQSPSTYQSKDISKVTVFNKYIKHQGKGHKVKNFGTHGKVLSQGILMWNIKALALTIPKLEPRFKFLADDGKTEWHTKTICPLIFDLGS